MTETLPRDMQLLLQNTRRFGVQCYRDNGLILVKVSGIETAEVQTYFIAYHRHAYPKNQISGTFHEQKLKFQEQTTT